MSQIYMIPFLRLRQKSQLLLSGVIATIRPDDHFVAVLLSCH